MKFSKLTLASLSVLTLALGFSSCSSDDSWDTTGDGKITFESSSRAFILNEGSMNKNNSNIYYFDWSSAEPKVGELYQTQNGRMLGDTGNDIITVGNEVVVAVNVSNYVALLDGYGVEQSRVSFENYKNLGQVRSVCYGGGYVYVTSYGGYVSRLQVRGGKLTYVDSLRVGVRPEDVEVLDGKLYVTLQGKNYDDNRLATVASDFKTVSYTTVMQDPVRVRASDGRLYVNGYGASFNNPWGMVDPATGKYTELGHATALGFGKGMIYLANSVTDWNTYKTSTTLSAYNTATGTTDTAFFKNVPSAIATMSVYSISVNPFNGKIYMATSDYVSDGTIYVFNAQGSYETSFTAGGINPHAIVFLK